MLFLIRDSAKNYNANIALPQRFIKVVKNQYEICNFARILFSVVSKNAKHIKV